ncbi:MAG: hypothetical protein MR890_03865 [Akkermansia muciniphila]|nr:hypothetical protein [Akkermansia muciniphila]
MNPVIINLCKVSEREIFFFFCCLITHCKNLWQSLCSNLQVFAMSLQCLQNKLIQLISANFANFLASSLAITLCAFFFSSFVGKILPEVGKCWQGLPVFARVWQSWKKNRRRRIEEEEQIRRAD